VQAAAFTNTGVVHGINGGTLIINTPSFVVTAGNTDLSGVSMISGLQVSGGTFGIDGTTPVTIQGATLTGGTITCDAPLTLAGTTMISGGTLAATGSFTNNGTVTVMLG